VSLDEFMRKDNIFYQKFFEMKNNNFEG